MKQKSRGSVRKSSSVFVGAWVPIDLNALLEKAISTGDTDRSKFVRQAVREKLQRESAR